MSSPKTLSGAMLSDMYRFDRKVPGVGRIQKSAGTANATEYRYRDGLLTKLVKAHARDILREFQAGRLTIGDLVSADREGRLTDVLAIQKLTRPLKESVEAWLPISAPEPRSRRRYQSSWDALRVKARLEKASIRDLEFVDWKRLQQAWGKTGADWNRMRAMVSAFLTHITGHRHSPFRLAVINRDRFPLGRESKGRIPELSVAEFWQLVKLTPDYVQPTIVAFAALSCGHVEFDGIRPEDVNAERHEVRLVSKKGPDRDRVVVVADNLWPWVSRAIQCSVQRKWRLIHFKRAAGKIGKPGLVLYDLRHLGAQLAADAGVNLRDIGTHLGHSNTKQTLRYARRKQAQAVGRAIGEALGGRG